MPEREPRPDSPGELALEACRLLLEARKGTTTLDDACAAAEKALSAEAIEWIHQRAKAREGLR